MALLTRQGQNPPPPNTNTLPHHMTSESVQAMIDQALLRNSTNGDGSQSSHEDNPRHVQTTRPCFYADFMKCHWYVKDKQEKDEIGSKPGKNGKLYSATVAVSSMSEAGGGGYEDSGSGGDGNAAEAMHLARRSPIKGGDSEVSGDGNGVGMAKSLSTFTSGGRDMEVCSRKVILAPVVAVSVEGGGMMGSVPPGEKASSLIGSKAHDVLSGLTLLNEPKPLGQHRPPLL
nr:hypothetical protein [Tanacetum cinerariifolium]